MWTEVKKTYPILYFDASGGVLKSKAIRQKQPFLFSMVRFFSDNIYIKEY